MATLAERLQKGALGLQAFQEAQGELMTTIKQEYDRVAAKVQEGVDIAGIDGRIEAKLNSDVGPWAEKVQKGASGIHDAISQNH